MLKNKIFYKFFFLIIFYDFNFNYSYAYLDPGTITIITQIIAAIIAALATFFTSVRNFFKKIFQKKKKTK